MSKNTAPLEGVHVVDFTTLAPGPLASLMLVRAGATVIKVERPGVGDEMRIYDKAFGDNGLTFSMLNAGKQSVSADLKNEDDLSIIKQLINKSDILLEQFRPGVMAKLGLGYESLVKQNPRLIYCAITGFGQSGPKSTVAAHDLNYVADTGMLLLGECPNGTPAIPPLLAADLAAGSYPAVMNILLALAKRERTGKGEFIDISMTDNLFPLMFWALGLGLGAGRWPAYGGELLSGGSPRYQIYRTSDSKYVAVAALEQRFWVEFCSCAELNPDELNEQEDPKGTIESVAAAIKSKTAGEWRKIFFGRDACTVVVNSLQEAVEDEHYNMRKLFDQKIVSENEEVFMGLPLPITPNLQDSSSEKAVVPALGEFNEQLESFLK